MFGRQRRAVFGALTQAAQDPATNGGWQTGLDIADRCGVLPGSSYPILLTATHRGEVEQWPGMNTAKPGLVYYRLTDQGIRRHQHDSVRRLSLLIKLLRTATAPFLVRPRMRRG